MTQVLPGALLYQTPCCNQTIPSVKSHCYLTGDWNGEWLTSGSIWCQMEGWRTAVPMPDQRHRRWSVIGTSVRPGVSPLHKKVIREWVALTLSARGPSLSRQNLTSVDVRFWRDKDGPRTERIKIWITTVDPQHRYSNEAERANEDVYDGFKLKITLWLKNTSAL